MPDSGKSKDGTLLIAALNPARDKLLQRQVTLESIGAQTVKGADLISQTAGRKQMLAACLKPVRQRNGKYKI